MKEESKNSCQSVNQAGRERERENVCVREREVCAGRRSLPSGKQHLSLHSAPPLFPLGISPTLQSSAFSSPDPPKFSRGTACLCVCVCVCVCICIEACEYLTLRSVLSVCFSVSLSRSLQLRWACGASDPLSPTLFLCLSLFAAATGGYGWTTFTSTHRGGFGLYRSVQLFCQCVFICDSVQLDAVWLFLALHYRSDMIS